VVLSSIERGVEARWQAKGGVLVAESVRLLKSDQRKLPPIRGQKHANSPRRSHCSGFGVYIKIRNQQGKRVEPRRGNVLY